MIRNALLQDVRSHDDFNSRCHIQRILVELAHAAYEQYVASIGMKPAPMVFDFASRLGIDRIEMIERVSQPLGYLVWQLTDEALFLESIAILPQQQGKGLARIAFTHLEKWRVQTIKLLLNCTLMLK